MKWRMVKDGVLVAVPIVIIAVLFAMRGVLVRTGSEQMSRIQDVSDAEHIADSVKLLYDYREERDGGVRYTFLEFGAKGCLSCRKMEQVMEDVRTEFAGRVKVRFMNVSEKETQEWTKYFGVAMIPTQIVLDSAGQEVFRHEGYISAEDLRKVFK